MPKYLAKGALRATGEEVEVILEAVTPAQAELTVNDMGVVVESVEPAVADALPVVTARPATPPLQALAVATHQQTEYNQPRPVTYVPAMRQVQTIERTGKSWKACQLVGAIGLMISVGACMTSGGFDADGSEQYIFLAGFSGLLFIIGRVGGWWYHG